MSKPVKYWYSYVSDQKKSLFSAINSKHDNSFYVGLLFVFLNGYFSKDKILITKIPTVTILNEDFKNLHFCSRW